MAKYIEREALHRKRIPCWKCQGMGLIPSIKYNKCEDCGGTGTIDIPMTNFDRIKAMTFKELAEFISSIHDTDIVSSVDKSIDGHIIPCYTTDSIKEWLESEVEE